MGRAGLVTEIPLEAPPPTRFTECAFVAHLKDIRTTTKGKVVTLEVPFDRMDLIHSLDRAVGIPLEVHCTVWAPGKVEE